MTNEQIIVALQAIINALQPAPVAQDTTPEVATNG